MNSAAIEDRERARELARSLDCLSEEDFCILADVTPKTAEAWRKRGKGPAYVLIGNRFLYPRGKIAEFLQGRVRERIQIAARAVL